MDEIFLSVIIPAYNEEKRIGKTLSAVQGYLSKQNYSYEIIVADDGSTDGTISVIPAIFKRESRGNQCPGSVPAKAGIEDFGDDKLLKVIRLPHHGKGNAVKQGMLQARGKYRLFMDADNSVSVEQWEPMRLLLESGFEVVFGSRQIRNARILIHQQFYKKAFGRMGNLLIQALLLPGIWDSQCGFKVFSAQAAEKIFSRVQLSGWAFDVEVLYLARRLGFKIKEAPVDWINDSHSHVKMRDYFVFLKDLMRIKFCHFERSEKS